MTDISIPSMRYASFRLLLKKQFEAVLSIAWLLTPALTLGALLFLNNLFLQTLILQRNEFLVKSEPRQR
jgi:hypothetical protein